LPRAEEPLVAGLLAVVAVRLASVGWDLGAGSVGSERAVVGSVVVAAGLRVRRPAAWSARAAATRAAPAASSASTSLTLVRIDMLLPFL
jgi:hypothetical protein